MKQCANGSNSPFSFYGSVTVGERGQIVIPAEARAEFGFQPGDKLLIMAHPIHQAIVVCKLDEIREFLNDFSDRLRDVEDSEAAGKDEQGRITK